MTISSISVVGDDLPTSSRQPMTSFGNRTHLLPSSSDSLSSWSKETRPPLGLEMGLVRLAMTLLCGGADSIWAYDGQIWLRFEQNTQIQGQRNAWKARGNAAAVDLNEIVAAVLEPYGE